MYKALYRKWRPQVFSDVIGQEHIVAILRSELRSGRVSHAYLFCGTRGTGKTTCAKIFSKAVNCLSPEDGDPCNRCEICKGIGDGSLLDVIEIDAASNNGVDNIRDIREEAVYTPASARWRVYIIDEVHMLSQGAFNALLKTLEEPPPHVIFILATTEAHKLPATILSRCQRFDFKRIPASAIAGLLLDIAGREGIDLTEEAAALIARLSDGAMRDALTLLEQCAVSGVPVDAAYVARTAGLASREYLFSLTDAAISHDYSAAFAILDSLIAEGRDVALVCEELIGHYRDLLMVKSVKKPQELLLTIPQLQSRLSEQAAQVSLEEVLLAVGTLQETLDGLPRSYNPRVMLELCLLRLCEPRLDRSADGLLTRISALEKRVAAGVPAASSAAPPPETAAPAEKPAAKPEKPVEKESEPERPKKAVAKASAAPFWDEVKEELRRIPATAGFIDMASASLRDGVLEIMTDSPIAYELLKRPEAMNELKTAVKGVSGQDLEVRLLQKGGRTEPEPVGGAGLLLRRAGEMGLRSGDNT